MGTAITVVIAVGSGLFGGVAVALLNVRHERAQAMRDRMLEAADAFTSSVQEALSYVDSVDPFKEPILLNTSSSEGHTRLMEMGKRISGITRPLARVTLLFHPSSAAADKAILATAWLGTRLRYARRLIEDERNAPQPETKEMFWAARENAIAAHRNFQTAAWEALRRPTRRWPKSELKDDILPSPPDEDLPPLP